MATMLALRTMWTLFRGGVCEYLWDGAPSSIFLLALQHSHPRVALKFPLNLKQERLQSDTERDFPTIILGPSLGP